MACVTAAVNPASQRRDTSGARDRGERHTSGAPHGIAPHTRHVRVWSTLTSAAGTGTAPPPPPAAVKAGAAASQWIGACPPPPLPSPSHIFLTRVTNTTDACLYIYIYIYIFTYINVSSCYFFAYRRLPCHENSTVQNGPVL